MTARFLRNTVVGFNPWFVSKDIKILHSPCRHKIGVGGGSLPTSR
nr:MAG TPA: hypothetical protein [Caudoviricetes sp.]